MFVVSDNNYLLRSRYKAKRLLRSNLTGLVDDEKIEGRERSEEEIERRKSDSSGAPA